MRGHARPSTGERPPRRLTSRCNQPKQALLRRPLESAQYAAVAMVNEPPWGSAALEGHDQSVDAEPCLEMLGHRPADNLTRRQILWRPGTKSPRRLECRRCRPATRHRDARPQRSGRADWARSAGRGGWSWRLVVAAGRGGWSWRLVVVWGLRRWPRLACKPMSRMSRWIRRRACRCP